MTRSGRPKVSVIVPCYNLGAFIDEAVGSVLMQTYQDFEIVIVNDGSTDPDTNRLLLDYQRPKTRVVQSDNRGLAAARNLAIEHSLGEYLCALDADDKLDPMFLEKTTNVLETDASVGFVSCWLRNFGTEDWVWKPDRCDLLTLLGECTVATPALVRKSAVQAAGGYDEHMSGQGYEDWDLWISLVELGIAGIIIPEVLFYYRRRPGSMSETCCQGDVHLALMQYMISKHETSYRQHLFEILLQKERISCELLKTTYALDREINGRLVPRIERRREELARLQRKLEVIQQREQAASRVAALERELARSNSQVGDLARALDQSQRAIERVLHSRSWRVTAPLRAVYDFLERAKGSGAGSTPLDTQGPTLPTEGHKKDGHKMQ